MRLQEASSFLLRLERVVGLVIFNRHHRHLGEVWLESVVMVTNENGGITWKMSQKQQYLFSKTIERLQPSWPTFYMKSFS